MQVIWNGTGSAWSYHFGNTSAILEAGEERLLLDCGHTVPGRLKQMGLSLQDFSGVVITHLHGDHIYGLEEWGFRNLLVWKTRPRLFIAQPLASPLWRSVLCGTMGQHCDNRLLL
jgi:ribonuclease BN (tRNA processing enzyme)